MLMPQSHYNSLISTPIMFAFVYSKIFFFYCPSSITVCLANHFFTRKCKKRKNFSYLCTT